MCLLVLLLDELSPVLGALALKYFHMHLHIHFVLYVAFVCHRNGIHIYNFLCTMENKNSLKDLLCLLAYFLPAFVVGRFEQLLNSHGIPLTQGATYEVELYD